ncbi:MAG TPA: lipid-A-disaccharide synthase [Bacteroidia bacterium]|nr:lipid-A-disaccharide synthase [Bacteroidia bacterium]
MNYYVIAGEPSGDLHGSNLLKAIKQVDEKAHFRCWGGDLMQAQGGEIIVHYKKIAFMGFVEVILNLRTILKNIAFCKEDILKHKPDALILIDYPGFNLRIAKWAKEQGIRVFYYISPTIWAWKENRINTVRDCVERMYVILPFEKKFYGDRGVEVEYYGHPLVDVLKKEQEKVIPRREFLAKYKLNEKPIIALLPGSRFQEIKRILPVMMQVIQYFPDYQFVVAATNSLPATFYQETTKGYPVTVITNDTYSIMQHAHVGLIKSGTSSIEAALFNLPHIVCYLGNGTSFYIAKKLVKVEYVSLVNLILGRLVVTELLQQDFTIPKIVEELKILLTDKKRYEILNDYKLLLSMLQEENISLKIANSIYKRLTTNAPRN